VAHLFRVFFEAQTSNSVCVDSEVKLLLVGIKRHLGFQQTLTTCVFKPLHGTAVAEACWDLKIFGFEKKTQNRFERNEFYA